MAKILESFSCFLIDYDDDTAHRLGVGILIGKISLVVMAIREIDNDMSQLDWQEFERRLGKGINLTI